MKKILLIAIAAVVAISASAAGKPMVMKSNPAITAKLNKIEMPTQKQALSTTEIMRAPKTLTPDGRPETFVRAQSGCLYASFVIGELSYYNVAAAFSAPFVDTKFINLTPDGDADSYLWQYYADEDSYGAPSLSSSEKDLTLNFTGGVSYGPSLTATNGQGDSTFVYTYVCAGGSLTLGANNDEIGLSNTSIAWKNNTGVSSMGYNPTQTQTYTASTDYEFMESYREVVDTLTIIGHAEFFAKPAMPYMLSQVQLVGAAESAGTMTMQIIKAKEVTDNEGNPYFTLSDEVLCTASVDFPYDAENWTNIVFKDLVYTDPEEGLESELIIEDPIFIVFTPDEGVQFAPAFRLHAAPIEDTYSYALANFTIGDEELQGLIDVNWRYGKGYCNSWAVSLGLTMEYIYCEDDTFEAPAEGGEKVFNMKSNYSTNVWEITTTDGDDIDDIDWLTLELENGTIEHEGQTYFNGDVKATVTADALPEGVTSRNVDLLFTYPGGAKYVMHITQGAGGQVGVKGDVDGSGIVDVDDVNAIINLILYYDNYKDKYPGVADVDGSGIIDVDDVNAVINIILGA